MQEVASSIRFNMDRSDSSNSETLSSAARPTYTSGQPSLQPHPESRPYASSTAVEGQSNATDIKTSSFAARPGSGISVPTVVRYSGGLPGQTSTGKVPQPRMAPKPTYPPLTIPDTQPVASGSGSNGRPFASSLEAKSTLPPVPSDEIRSRQPDAGDDGFPNERRLFHAYIYDYLYRQGHQQAARAFLLDLPTTAVIRSTQNPAPNAKASIKGTMQGKGKKRSRENDETMDSDGEEEATTAPNTGSHGEQRGAATRGRTSEHNGQENGSQETSASQARGRKRKSQEEGGPGSGRPAADTSDSMMDMMLLFSDGSPTSPTSSTASATDLQNNLVITEILGKAAPATSNSDQSSNGSSANSKDSVTSTTSTAATNASVHMGPSSSRQSSFIFNSDTGKLASMSSPPPFGSLTTEKDDSLASPITDSPHPLSASSSKATVKNTSILQPYDTLPKPDVQISAPQGFLFEWWTVFWDIYRSKHDLQPSTMAARVFMQAAESNNFPTANGEILRSASLPMHGQYSGSGSNYPPVQQGAYQNTSSQPQSALQDRAQSMQQAGVRQLPFRQQQEDVSMAMARQRTENQSPGRSRSLQLPSQPEEDSHVSMQPSQAPAHQQHAFQREREHMLAGPPTLDAMAQRSDEKPPAHPAQVPIQQTQQALRENPSQMHSQQSMQAEQGPVHGQLGQLQQPTPNSSMSATGPAAQQPHSGARAFTPLNPNSSPHLAGETIQAHPNLQPAQRQLAQGRPPQAHPQSYMQQPPQYQQQVQMPAHHAQGAMQSGIPPGGPGLSQQRNAPGQPGPASAQRRFAITGTSPFPPGQQPPGPAPGPGMVRMVGGPPPAGMGAKPPMHPQIRLAQGPPSMSGQAGSPGMLHAAQQGYTVLPPGHQGQPPPQGYYTAAPSTIAQQQQAQQQAHAHAHAQHQQMHQMQQAQNMARLSAQGGVPPGQPGPQPGPGPQPSYVNGSLLQRQQMQQHIQSQGQYPGVSPNPAAALASRQRPASVASVPMHVQAQQGPDNASSPSNLPMRAPSRTAASSPFARPQTVDAQRPEQQPGPFGGRQPQPIQMNPAYAAAAAEDGQSPVRRPGLSPESQEQIQTRIAEMQRQQQQPIQSMSPSMMNAEHAGNPALAAYRQSISATQQAQRQRQASLGIGMPGQQPSMGQGAQQEAAYAQQMSGPQHQQAGMQQGQQQSQMHQQQHHVQQQQQQPYHPQQQHPSQQQHQQTQMQMAATSSQPGVVHQPLFRQTPQQMPQQQQQQPAISQYGNPIGEYVSNGQHQGQMLQPYSQATQQYSAGASPHQHSAGASPSAQGTGQEQSGAGMPLSQIQEAISRHPLSKQPQPSNQMPDGSMPPPRRPANGGQQQQQQGSQPNRAPTPASQANTPLANGMSQGSPEAATPHTPRTPNTQAVASGVVTNPAPPATKGRKRTATDPTTKETKKKPRNSRASATAAAAAAANSNATSEPTPPSSANDVQVPEENPQFTQSNDINNGGSLPHRQASIDMSAYFSNGAGGQIWAPGSANGLGNIAVPGSTPTALGHGRQGSITADFMASLGATSQNAYDISSLPNWDTADVSAGVLFGDMAEFNFDEYVNNWDSSAA